MAEISYVKLSLTVDGGSNGILTVSSTSALVKEAIVFISSDTQEIKKLIVDEIISATEVAVRDGDLAYVYNRFDCSAYLVADSATLTQPEQSDFYTQDDGTGSIVLEEEGVGQGVVGTLDFQGSAVTASVSSGTGIITISGGGADTGDVASNPTFETQAALTYYVDTAGSDSNDGSIGSPFLTIYKALTVLPKRILHAVTINVGAGNFAGYQIWGFTFSEDPTTGLGGSLSIVGTTITATLASGLTTGTIDAAGSTNGTANSATWGTAVVTGAGWTANDLIGKWIRIDVGTGVGQYQQIAFNTTDTITITGNWTAPHSATFTIVDAGTVINSGAPGGSSYGARMFANVGNLSAPIILNTIKTTQPRGLLLDTGDCGVSVTRCAFTGNVVGITINELGGTSPLTVTNSYFVGQTSTVQRSISIAGSCQVNVTDCVFSGSVIGIGMGLLPAQITCTTNYYRAITAAATRTTGSLRCTGDRIDAVTPGSRIGYDLPMETSGNTAFGTLRLAACDISNCGTAINLVSQPAWAILTGVVSGTGNTTGLKLTRGASAIISSTTTLTTATSPTGEISIDGVSTTLATLRAASPKVIMDPDYGTKVYE